MFHSNGAHRARTLLSLAAALAVALVAGTRSSAQGSRGMFRLSGHVPSLSFISRDLGPVAAQEPVQLAVTLPLRNADELQDLIGRLYDPQDPEYGHFLTPEEFADRFSPTEAQYRQVAAYAQAQGLAVTGVHSNRLVLDVTGPAGAVEQAFNTRLKRFQSRLGQVFRAPEVEPGLPAELAGSVVGVVGLDDLARFRPHHYRLPVQASGRATGRQTGSGPGGALTPANIKAAYNLSGTTLTGAGQTLALFELDGYKASDVTAYENAYGLPNVPLQNVLVDGYSGAAGSGAAEVTLDIELQAALAPGVSKIIVYEGPNSGSGAIDTYNRIATDNLAKSISSSWGLPELQNSSSGRNAENTIFQQMAAQGQSIFAASGDSGAYDDGSTISVDDPASQPYVTGVGGTHLTTAGAGGAWQAESTWNNGSASAGGGGGGISKVWSAPSYQSGLATGANKASSTMRNVPDVSLDADPGTGYSIYFNGGWAIYGGTSCAAPLWSAFTALVNQARAAAGSGPVGFVNPTLYQLGKGSRGAVDFHDIADGSTNLYYPAVTGYDCATGWGSFNGGNLLPDLSGTSNTTPSAPAAPTGLTATAGVGQVSLAWNGSTGATSYAVKRGTVHGGPYTALSTSLTATSYTDGGLTAGTTYYYVVTASNAGGESATSNEAGATPTAATVTPTKLTISGTVSANGKPVAGATVVVWSAHISTTSAADGSYVLGYFTSGTYTVSAFGGGYSFPDATVALTTGNATGVNFTYGAATTTYTISGTVTSSGAGLAGVTVTAGSQSAVTGSTGAYTLAGLVAGSYSVSAAKSGYTLSAAQSVTVGPNATGINFTAGAVVTSTYSISGTVTAGGAGLAGATVTAGSVSTTTAVNGSYTLSGLTAGTYSVSATASGYTMSAAQSVSLSANVTGVNFTATAVVTGTSFTISGTARVNGVPIGGITVAVFGTGIATTTAADGTYTLGYFSSGTYSITAFGKGYSFNSPTVTVGPSKTGVDLSNQ